MKYRVYMAVNGGEKKLVAEYESEKMHVNAMADMLRRFIRQYEGCGQEEAVVNVINGIDNYCRGKGRKNRSHPWRKYWITEAK